MLHSADARGSNVTAPRPGDAASVKAGPIDYAPAPRWHRRRGVRRVALLVLFLAASLAVWRWGRPALGHALLLHEQRQCMTHEAPPVQIVYEEDPGAASGLVSRGSGSGWAFYKTGYASSAAAAYVPPYWAKYAARLTPPAATAGATVFLHELRAPGGRSFLVALQFVPRRTPGSFTTHIINGFNCSVEVIEPAGLRSPPRPVRFPIALSVPSSNPSKPPNVRVFAGQVDEADPSHFTVRYEMWGQADTLDGWIDDRGMVTLSQRQPPEWPR